MSFPFAGPSHAPYNRFKRPRSSSPPTPPSPNSQNHKGRGGFEALASPLEEVLIKRRRRDEAFGYFGGIVAEGGSQQAGQLGVGRCEAGGGNVQPGVERRRNRLWAARNAPSFGSQESQGHCREEGPSWGARSRDVILEFSDTLNLGTNHDMSQPPFHSHTGHVMSSSPVRHEPPGSSPFKSASQMQVGALDGMEDDATVRMTGRQRPGLGNGMGMGMDGAYSQAEAPHVGYSERGGDVGMEEMDIEELQKEWGEYRGANSLLYQLHRARTTPHNDRTRPFNAYHTPNNGLTTPLNDQDTPHHTKNHDYFNNIETPIRSDLQAYASGGQTNMLDPVSAFVTPFPSRTQQQPPALPHAPRGGDGVHIPSSPNSPHLPTQHGGVQAYQHGQSASCNHTDQQSHQHQNHQDQYTAFRSTQHIPSSPFAPPSASSTQFPSSSATRFEHDEHNYASPLPLHRHSHGQGLAEKSAKMNMDEEQMQREEQEAMRRYEEMNRQLGEFNVARRERWGVE